MPRRSPYGERGLKFEPQVINGHFHGSLSLRRAWIEMCLVLVDGLMQEVALLTESVD